MQNIESELLYSKNWCKIYFHAAVPCVRLEWIGFATSQEFREACKE